VCHRVQLGVDLRAESGVCFRAFCELTWEWIVKQAGSVQLGVYLRACSGV